MFSKKISIEFPKLLLFLYRRLIFALLVLLKANDSGQCFEQILVRWVSGLNQQFAKLS